MFKQLLLLLTSLLGVVFLLNGQINDQNYRTYSGINNNPIQSDWGAVNSNLLNITDIGFTNGYESPSGEDRPNPRDVSNGLFDQDGLINDPMGLSDFCWVWGQFIDHDIGLTSDGPEYMPIQVPAGDPDFDPFGVGQAIIPMHRNVFMPLTGTNVGNPRRYPNEITAFIDGSGVYGSDETKALWLRSFEEGKLRTSSGNLLPFNTLNGDFYDEIDPTAPFMANATGISDKIFVAGDIRASENSLLLSFHTLFMREHNRQCDRLKMQHPDWTDEQLYHYARKIVGGIIQSVMFDEWLPAVGIELPVYTGYDSAVNPQLSNVFTAAAYRVGHTLLSSSIQRLDENGDVIPEGNSTLQEAFFNPFTILELGTIDPYLKGMAVQVQQGMDAKVISDIRNFLFGQPGFGGLDLASININRGRERGLVDYNTIRENIGLNRLNFFQQINTSSTVFGRLQTLYGNIDKIDPWVGMLSEMPISGSIFGPTIHTILSNQFLNLRDGDRFYYWNDPVLTTDEKEYIQAISLRDVIMYNTSITVMQDNVFGALPHEEICQNMTLNINGTIVTEQGTPVSNVDLNLVTANAVETVTTEANGLYNFLEAPFCTIDFLIPERNDNIINGVSTFDIVLIQKHILGVDLLDTPYKWIAADINNSNSITTIDLIRLRKAILGIDTEFSGNTSWRFILASFEFPLDQSPFSVDFPEFIDFSNENSTDLNAGFIAVKIGDVNNSASLFNRDDTHLLSNSETTSIKPLSNENRLKNNIALSISYPEIEIQAGETYTVPFQIESDRKLEGFQFELEFIGLKILNIETSINKEFYAINDSKLRMSWNSKSEGQVFKKLVNIQFIALKNGVLNQLIDLKTTFSPEVYDKEGGIHAVGLLHKELTKFFIVEQNHPNPFNNQTEIPFYLYEQDDITLTIIDLSGRTVFQSTNRYVKGWHKWVVDRSLLSGEGYYQYELKSSTMTVNKSMILHKE